MRPRPQQEVTTVVDRETTPPVDIDTASVIDVEDGIDTGGKGPNNQWAHAEYIENPVNK